MQIKSNEGIIERCAELGISVETALAIGKESGYDDAAAVCWAVGLDPVTLRPLLRRNWARMAAINSSTSYSTQLPEETLMSILASGEVPVAFIAQISHFLDEAPAQLLVMAAEQVGQQARCPMPAIWSNILNLANKTGSSRPNTWTINRRRPEETGVMAAGAG